MGRLRRREPHAFQCPEPGRRFGAHSRQPPAHHPRHDIVRSAQRLRQDLRNPEFLLQLGPAQNQRRILARRRAAELPLQLPRQDAGRIVVSERHAFQRQPSDRGCRLAAFRRQGVEHLHRRRSGQNHGRQNDGRSGRIRRFPPKPDALADARRRAAPRPPLARGHGVGAAGRAVVPAAAQCPDQGDGQQRIPFPDDPRNVYVPAAESRSETRKTDELRTFIHTARVGRGAFVRDQRLLHRRRQHDPDRSGGRTPEKHQYGPDRELGRRGRRGLPHKPRVGRFGQLQLPPHGLSGGRSPRTQTLRRGRFFAQTLEGIDGRAVYPRTLHLGQTRGQG